VIDTIRECRPPFSTDDVVIEFAALLKSYGVRDVTGAPYAKDSQFPLPEADAVRQDADRPS
jgi:hypothetical protein